MSLAVAMANEPDLLLADEVVAQLDGETAGRVVDDVLASDVAVLFVTHDVALARPRETTDTRSATGRYGRADRRPARS